MFLRISEVPFHFFNVCLQELTTALEKNPDDAECYCQRAYAHILLQKYAGNIFSLGMLLQVYHNMFYRRCLQSAAKCSSERKCYL